MISNSHLLTAASIACLACAGADGTQRPAVADNPLQLTPQHATVSVSDLARETEWYQRVLGFQAIQHVVRPTGFELTRMALPSYRIDFIRQQGSHRPPEAKRFYQQGWLHIGFEAANLDAAVQRLTALGIPIDEFRDAKTQQLRSLTLHDPEGNEIEIAIPLVIEKPASPGG